jgi:hypothetical protein
MKKVIILALYISVGFVSCCKEQPECTSGKLVLVNASDKFVKFSIGGNMGTIEASSHNEFELNADQDIHVKVEQEGGFLQGTTVKDWNIRIEGCKDTVLIFTN